MKAAFSDDRFDTVREFFRDVARRLRVCVVWLIGTLSGPFWARSATIAVLDIMGVFFQGVAFVAAVKLVMHVSIAPDLLLGRLIDPENWAAVFAAAAAVAFMISVAGALIYKARRRAIRLSADFESERFVAAIQLIRQRRADGQEIPKALETEILQQSPRFMGRMLLQLLAAVPAALTGIVALAGALWLNFSLSAMLILTLVLLSPAFLLFMIRSSQTSRRMMVAGPNFSVAKKHLASRFFRARREAAGSWRSTVVQDEDYKEFLEAYQDRIAIAPFAQFINAVSFSVAMLVFVFWFYVLQDKSVGSLTNLIVSLVLLRFFMRSINIVMSAMAVSGSFYPYFANYITLASGEGEAAMSFPAGGAAHQGDDELV